MMRLSEAAEVTGGALRGRDAEFTGVAIDSRQLRRGELFVAIRGARDGHDFIAQAADKGAAGALVAANSDAGAGGKKHFPRIHVPDTTAALGQLGAHWRGRFDLSVIAVTGSNGKTTVTALTAAIMARAGDCLAPRASFNNQWGVPLTLLRLRASHACAVVEIGMNRAGEIAPLSALARPSVALINNVAPAHLGGFADLAGVAKAKAEIFAGLDADGCAVLNADDDFYDFWRGELAQLGGRRVVSFSAREDSDADIRAAQLADGRVELAIAGQTVAAEFALTGAHNLANAAAAAAAAHAAGAPPEQIAAGLSTFPGALPGRGQAFTGPRGATIIDDSYNANPTSLRLALDALAAAGRGGGARIAVLGAMAELGRQSDAFHREIGRHARLLGIEHVLCLGAPDDRGLNEYLRGYGDGDSESGGGGDGEICADIDALLARLFALLESSAKATVATVLIKGSRSTGMERVTAKLKSAAEKSGADQSSGDQAAAANAKSHPANDPHGGASC